MMRKDSITMDYTFSHQLAALTHQQQWAEVMGWLDGGGDWTEEERGVMLSAVLDFVDEVERTSP
jgi:hypothetical protein